MAFRVSPDEDREIETAVRLSGLTKQDYITRRLLCRDVVVQGNPGLKDKKSWWRVSPSCFGGGLCGGGRARRWRRPIWG